MESMNQLYSPLLSWDFLKSGISRQNNFTQDKEDILAISDQNDWNVTAKQESLDYLEKGFVVVVSCPIKNISWVSTAFSVMTGYNPDEVIGNQPRMLQGPGTNLDTLKNISKHLSAGKQISESVLNYRKDGTTYWCELTIKPVINKSGECVNYVAYERAA